MQRRITICSTNEQTMRNYLARDPAKMLEIMGMCVLGGLAGAGMPPHDAAEELRRIGIRIEAIEDMCPTVLN